VLNEITVAVDKGIIDSHVTVNDCTQDEGGRILDCAAASGSVLIASDDQNLLSMFP